MKTTRDAGIIARSASLTETPMQFAILCFHNENTVKSWTPEQDDAVMEKLSVVHERLCQEGSLGPSARLDFTNSATTLRKNSDPPVVTDGPFAETKEALLGFYVVDVADMQAALAVARDLTKANPGGAYEIRPIRLYLSGAPMPREVSRAEAAA